MLTSHIYTNRKKNTFCNTSPFFQPKLTINQPNDIYEQEADAMAEKVMRINSPVQQKFFTPSVFPVQRKCAACEEEEKQLHRKHAFAEASAGGGNSADDVRADNNFENYVNNLNSSGTPLSSSSKQFFESRFGNDFSNVRIHNDAVAAKSAASINALAYTSGNNIVFNEGQYAPGTESGDKLLAHELTHVVQQGEKAPSAAIKRNTIFRQPAAAAATVAIPEFTAPVVTTTPVYITGGAGNVLTVIEGGAGAAAGGSEFTTIAAAGGSIGILDTGGGLVLITGVPVAGIGLTGYLVFKTGQAQHDVTYTLNIQLLNRFEHERVEWLTGKRFLSVDEEAYWQPILNEWAKDNEFMSRYIHVADLLNHGVPLQAIQEEEGSLIIVAESAKKEAPETKENPCEQLLSADENCITLIIELPANKWSQEMMDYIEDKYALANEYIEEMCSEEETVPRVGYRVEFNPQESTRFKKTNKYKNLSGSWNVDEALSRFLGGLQVPQNQVMLPEDVNKSLGNYEANSAKQYPDGTPVCKIVISWI